MAVRYFTDDCTYRLPQKRLTARWLHEVAAGEGYALGDVTYIFCSAQRLLEMNRQYLGHDYFIVIGIIETVALFTLVFSLLLLQ